MTTATLDHPGVDVREFVADVGAERESGAYPQAGFMFEAEQFYAGYFGGVGIGKSLALVMDFFAYAYEYSRSRQILTEPSYQMVRDILIPTVMDYFGPEEGRRFNMTRSPPLNITFRNGSEIWLRSTETGQRMYGPNVARVGMDEVTLGHQQEQMGILDQRCRQPGYPNQLKMTGTPKGRNWVYDFFLVSPRPARPAASTDQAVERPVRPARPPSVAVHDRRARRLRSSRWRAARSARTCRTARRSPYRRARHRADSRTAAAARPRCCGRRKRAVGGNGFSCAFRNRSSARRDRFAWTDSLPRNSSKSGSCLRSVSSEACF